MILAIKTKRETALFIKDMALEINEQALHRAIKYLLSQAGTMLFVLSNLIKKHLIGHLFRFKFYSNCFYFLYSQLLFVVREQIFRNYNVYNGLNSTLKRARMPVGRRLYGH